MASGCSCITEDHSNSSDVYHASMYMYTIVEKKGGPKVANRNLLAIISDKRRQNFNKLRVFALKR